MLRRKAADSSPSYSMRRFPAGSSRFSTRRPVPPASPRQHSTSPCKSAGVALGSSWRYPSTPMRTAATASLALSLLQRPHTGSLESLACWRRLDLLSSSCRRNRHLLPWQGESTTHPQRVGAGQPPVVGQQWACRAMREDGSGRE
eukprot:755503-Hanusia_phi.AAC.5